MVSEEDIGSCVDASVIAYSRVYASIGAGALVLELVLVPTLQSVTLLAGPYPY